MRITKIELENFACLAGKHVFDTDAGMVFLVGENNTGKTSLLKSMDFVENGCKAEELEEIQNISNKQDGMMVSLKLDSAEEFTRESSNCNDGKKIIVPFYTNLVLSSNNPEDVVNFSSTNVCGKLLKLFTKDFQASATWKSFEEAHKKAFEEDADSLKKKSEKMSKNIKEVLTEIYPNIEIELHFPGIEAKDIIKNTGINIDDGVKTSSSQKGSGLQRALAFAIIKTYADFQKKDDKSKPSIFLIDEPETSMHPRMQKSLMEALRKISQNEQVFIATHSPYILKEFKKEEDKIIILSRDKETNNITSKPVTELNSLPFSPSIGEINYYAFHLPTEEFHNELYGQLHYLYIGAEIHKNAKSQARSITEFDKSFLQAKSKLSKKNWIRDINTKKTNGSDTSEAPTSEDVHLSTFIRHKIHHPENKYMGGQLYTNEELQQSIEELIKLIKEYKVASGD